MFICIEGNIGAGKSTLAKALSKKLKASFLPEQFEENTLLPLFYKNKKTFAFPTEYSFLIDRQKQLTNYFQGQKDSNQEVVWSSLAPVFFLLFHTPQQSFSPGGE